MKKLKMARSVTLTFEEGCNEYLENCRQRNLREGTIEHYRQSYMQFYKFFDPKMPIEDIDEQTYKDYVLHLKSTLDNDVSINSYLRDLITTFHFFMNEGWLPHFKMQAIKVDKSHIETYSDSELQALLKKPNVKKCSFMMALAEEQIKAAFDQAEEEVTDLHSRISQGMREAKKNGVKIGLAKGSTITTKKALTCMAIIKKHSKDFGGTLDNPDFIKLCGCSRNSYYKYKKAVKESSPVTK